MINSPNHRMFVYLSVKKLKFKTSRETCARATMAFSEFTTELSSCFQYPLAPGHPWPQNKKSTSLSGLPYLRRQMNSKKRRLQVRLCVSFCEVRSSLP